MPKLREAPKKSEEPFERPDPQDELFENKPPEEKAVDNVELKKPAEPKKSDVEGPEVALQKQLEALKKSEETQRNLAAQANREREEALRRVRERDAELARVQKETLQSRTDAISSAIAAATAEAEAAQNEIDTAAASGDTTNISKAYRKLARAEANLAQLEAGKTLMEEEAKKEPPKEQDKPPATIEEAIDRMQIPAQERAWLKVHQDYLTDNRKQAHLQYAHQEALAAGHKMGETGYLQHVEETLGMREKPKPEIKDEEAPAGGDQSGADVSAPVSRDAPSGSRPAAGQVRLTAAQREAAKLAGVTEAEYAKQFSKYRQMVADGTYGGRE